MAENITEKDRIMAAVCGNCPACRHARKAQRGLIYRFVRTVEGRLCPFCRAYEKVYGRKAHERAPSK
jgi:Zn ribbon nucleic-acid-binding protein